MTKLVETMQKEIDNHRKGDYLNIDGSVNQIVNANVFSKKDYKDFYFNQKDAWVEGGHMVDPSEVEDDNIVISYYNDSELEESFIVGNFDYIEPEQIALNRLALNEIEYFTLQYVGIRQKIALCCHWCCQNIFESLKPFM